MSARQTDFALVYFSLRLGFSSFQVLLEWTVAFCRSSTERRNADKINEELVLVSQLCVDEGNGRRERELSF